MAYRIDLVASARCIYRGSRSSINTSRAFESVPQRAHRDQPEYPAAYYSRQPVKSGNQQNTLSWFVLRNADANSDDGKNHENAADKSE